MDLSPIMSSDSQPPNDTTDNQGNATNTNDQPRRIWKDLSAIPDFIPSHSNNLPSASNDSHDNNDTTSGELIALTANTATGDTQVGSTETVNTQTGKNASGSTQTGNDGPTFQGSLITELTTQVNSEKSKSSTTDHDAAFHDAPTTESHFAENPSSAGNSSQGSMSRTSQVLPFVPHTSSNGNTTLPLIQPVVTQATNGHNSDSGPSIQGTSMHATAGNSSQESLVEGSQAVPSILDNSSNDHNAQSTPLTQGTSMHARAGTSFYTREYSDRTEASEEQDNDNQEREDQDSEEQDISTQIQELEAQIQNLKDQMFNWHNENTILEDNIREGHLTVWGLRQQLEPLRSERARMQLMDWDEMNGPPHELASCLED
jgi:hypothetical protein